jgi:hypothetical protein
MYLWIWILYSIMDSFHPSIVVAVGPFPSTDAHNLSLLWKRRCVLYAFLLYLLLCFVAYLFALHKYWTILSSCHIDPDSPVFALISWQKSARQKVVAVDPTRAAGLNSKDLDVEYIGFVLIPSLSNVIEGNQDLTYSLSLFLLMHAWCASSCHGLFRLLLIDFTEIAKLLICWSFYLCEFYCI